MARFPVIKALRLLAVGTLLACPPAALADTGGKPVIEAQNVAAALTDPVEQLIRRQMAAIRDRDAETALALTTGSFHEKFAKGADFLSNLRWEHRFLYNHADYAFLERHSVPGGFVQHVEIRGRNQNLPVTVIFRVEEQDSGDLLIDSITVLDTDAQPI